MHAESTPEMTTTRCQCEYNCFKEEELAPHTKNEIEGKETNNENSNKNKIMKRSGILTKPP
jgi:hypothetical protein